MDEKNLAPPIDIQPEGHDVDQSTRDFIDAALSPITAAVEELRNAVNHRRDERTLERAETARDIAAIREYVETVKAQRDKEMSERPTVADVDGKIAAAIERATATFATAITSAISPLTLEMATISGQVRVRLSDRDSAIERHEAMNARLDTRMGTVEHQGILTRQLLTDISRDLYGDAAVVDGPPSVFGELREIRQLLVERENAWRQKLADDGLLVDARIRALENQLSPVKVYIEERIRDEALRAERRRRMKEAVVKFVVKSPLWFKLGGILITGGGGLALLWDILSRTFGL
jgi:hypothetical protein